MRIAVTTAVSVRWSVEVRHVGHTNLADDMLVVHEPALNAVFGPLLTSDRLLAVRLRELGRRRSSSRRHDNYFSTVG